MSSIDFKHAREIALALQPQERASLLHDLRLSFDEPSSEAAVAEAVADRWADLYASVCTCEIAELGVADTLTEESMTAADWLEQSALTPTHCDAQCGSSRATGYLSRRLMAASSIALCHG
jgi:hypothetical protein